MALNSKFDTLFKSLRARLLPLYTRAQTKLLPLKSLLSKNDKLALIDAKFLCIVFLCTLFYAFSNIDDFIVHLFEGFLWNFAVFFVLFYACSFLGDKIFKTVRSVIFWLVCVVCLINAFLLINFDGLLDSDSFQIFLATNTREASEFIAMYVNAKTLLALFSIIAVSLLAWFFKFSLTLSKRFCTLLAGVCLVILAQNVIKSSFQSSTQKTQLFHTAQVLSQGVQQQNDFIKAYKELDENMSAMLAQKLASEKDKNSTLSKSYISQNKKISKIILIIGESTQRNYMQIYGYDLPTTPHLNKLVKSQNLFVFDDIVSPQTHTAFVLDKLLTFANYENNATTPWYHQMNIIDAMNLLDYKSFWLSNQEQISVWNNVAEVIAKRASVQHFSNTAFSGGSNAKDEILLQMFDELKPKINAKENQFIIFHLMGTHESYDKRYPKEYEKFSTQMMREKGLDKFYKSDKKLNDSQLKIRAEYANAVLYNDFVVSKIIQKFKDDDAIVFYISDHGDEVYDYRNFSGHTWNYASRFMVEIPFMIYMSDTFKKRHPNIAKRVKRAQHKPFMSDNFMHALFDLLDIKCVELDKTLSPFNSKYNASRARMIGGKDYDKELKEPELAFLVPDKIYLHRTDEPKKVEDFFGSYQNFEIDVHFFDGEMVQNVGKNAPYFDVGHDGLKHSIGLNLGQMLALIRQKDDEFKAKALPKQIKTRAKIWLDFKNLSDKNAKQALQELIKICKQTRFKHGDIIVESSDYKALAAFKQAGFYTSYYVPYYDEALLKTNEQERAKISTELRAIAASGAVNALSFPHYLYEFVKSLGLKCDLLTWNDEKSWRENTAEKAFSDSQIKVILAGEKGEYR